MARALLTETMLLESSFLLQIFILGISASTN
jgi:hypothetical protein